MSVVITKAGSRWEFYDTTTLQPRLPATSVRIPGSLTVVGAAVTEDVYLTLNNDKTAGAPTEDGGLRIRRGASPYAGLFWDESAGEWVSATSTDGTLGGTLAYVPMRVGIGTSAAALGLTFGATGNGIYCDAAGVSNMIFVNNGGVIAYVNPTGLLLNTPLFWNAAGTVVTTGHAADQIHQKRGANPQAFRVYNTTDGTTLETNAEWGALRWASNVLYIEATKSGTGTLRDISLRGGRYLYLGSDDGDRWYLGTGVNVGHLYALADYAIRAGGGSAAAPSYSFTGDTNTGFFSVAPGYIGVSGDGYAAFAFSQTVFILDASSYIGWANTTVDGSLGLFLTKKGAASLRLGSIDTAAPVAQTLTVQGVVAGTANTAGANFTIDLSQSTGSGAGGSLIVRGTAAGGAGSSQNAYGEVFSVGSSGAIIGYYYYTQPAGLFVARSGATAGVTIDATADGVLRLTNYAGTDFARACFGGTSASFPALRRSTVYLEAVLADQSDYAPFIARNYTVPQRAGTAPAGVATQAIIFSEDNGAGKTRLMVQFPSGAAQQLSIEP